MKSFLATPQRPPVVEFDGRRDQIDARIATCHACRLTLPHDTFMGIRRTASSGCDARGAHEARLPAPSGRCRQRDRAQLDGEESVSLLHGRVSASPSTSHAASIRPGRPAVVDRAHAPSAGAGAEHGGASSRDAASPPRLDVMQRRAGAGAAAWCRARSSWRARCAAGRSSAPPSDSRRAAPSACDTPPASCRNGSSDAASAS